MAGANKVLKENQVLFKAGDPSDGMYLIRKGELRVYLEQEGKEVTLATIPAGGMIGEMALFDKQPRSASVKSVGQAEVTLISTEDFGKLMKQIPKWFVGLMSALSGRLRQTNERLQRLENGGIGSRPYLAVTRMLNVSVLLWHKDGEKIGKEWAINKSHLEKGLTHMFAEDPQTVRQMFEVLIKCDILSQRTDEYNNVVFCISNRAVLNELTNFMTQFIDANPKMPCLPDEALNMLEILDVAAQDNPYDAFTASVDDLVKEGQKQALDTSRWKEILPLFKNLGDSVRLVKTSDGSIGLRTTKKEIPVFRKRHLVIAAFYKANLV